MPKTYVTIDHTLGKDEALQRLHGMLAQIKDSYGSQISDLDESWSENGGSIAFKAMGFKIDADIAVTDTQAAFDVELPWAAKMFQGTIETTIRERAERLLA